MPDYVIGLDIGGTRIKSGAVSPAGVLSAAGVRPSTYALSAEQVLEALLEEVARIADVTGERPKAIAVGFPGAVDPEFGSVMLPGKLRVEGFPMVPRLREATGVPVVAENDGRLSIFAERAYGQAKGHKWAVTITLGTGVGSGVMLDGMVLRDPHLQFGTQASHTVLNAADDRICISRARGTADTLCSAVEPAMMVRDGLQRGLPSTLSDAYFDDPQRVDFEAVVKAASEGDALCRDALERWTTNLGWFLVNVVHVYAPQIIILGGGAANAAEHFLRKVQVHVDDHTFRYPVGASVPIVVSKLGDHAGVLGAAALGWESLNRL